MEIGNLTAAQRRRIDQNHRAMTQAALVDVFEQTEQEARAAVDSLWDRYQFAPERERDLLLHNDPVALACDRRSISTPRGVLENPEPLFERWPTPLVETFQPVSGSTNSEQPDGSP